MSVLSRAAALFRIRKGWLETGEGGIYEPIWCYKQPQFFFDALAEVDTSKALFPVVALFDGRKLDRTLGREQPLALLLVEHVADLEDERIVRYRVFLDRWDWDYWKSRIQLKAMVRVLDQMLHTPVPLYRADAKSLEAVVAGNLVPRRFIHGPGARDCSLDDYACSESEHAQAKECDELPRVLEYIQSHKLDHYARRVLKN